MERVWSKYMVATIVATTSFVACGGDDDREQTGPVLLDVPETVAIGVLPEPPSDSPTLPTPPPPPTTAVSDTTVAPDLEPIEGPIGDEVLGDRIIMLGDSILASTGPTGTRLMCEALAVFGWDAEIDAESGADLDFASEVLDDRLRPEAGLDWDVVGLLFGNEVDGDDPDAVADFANQLDVVLARVSPRPIVLYTLVEIDAARAALNEAIRDRARFHPNVVIVEFALSDEEDLDAVVDEDGLTLTDEGANRLALLTAAELGRAPGDADGGCLVPSESSDTGSDGGDG